MSTGSVGKDDSDYKRRMERLFGSAPWAKLRERKEFRVKVFQSGNSVAVRLPAELGFKAGSEMKLDVEDGVYLSLEPITPEKRKFNIAKVAGSATNLQPIRDEDRYFEERQLDWPVREREGGGTDPE